MKEILNIKKEFGSECKLDKDPAWQVPDQKPEDKEWLYIITCRKGGEGAHIYTHGYRDDENALGFFGTSGKTKKQLLQIPNVQVHAEGDTEYLITFPLRAFEQVARIVHLRRKRRLSAAHQESLFTANCKSRYRKAGNE